MGTEALIGCIGRKWQDLPSCGQVCYPVAMKSKAVNEDPMTSMNVSLPESLRRFAERRASDGYSSVSEYFRELLRFDRERVAEGRLEALLIAGLDSGEPIEVDEGFWERKRRDIEARHERSARK